MQSNSYPNNVYPSLSDPVYASTVEGKVGPYKSLYRRVAFKRDAFVNTTALQDVSMQATGTTIQATNAPLGANIEIVSTSANDTAAGSGARKVVIHYLDANFAEADMEVTLNGTTPVNLGTVCQYINFVHVSSIGTAGGIAAGTISIRNVATPTTLYSTISGENVDMTSLFTVPAGYSALLTHIEVNVFHSSANTNNRVILRVDACDWGGITFPGVFQAKFDHIYGSQAQDNTQINVTAGPLSTFKISATPSATASGFRVSGFYQIVLINADIL